LQDSLNYENQARIRALRESKAKEIVKQLSGRISLEYIKNGNRIEYEQLLSQLFKGTHAQNQVIKSIVYIFFTSCRNEALIQEKYANCNKMCVH
jgi:hypothetical protein